MLFTCLHYVRFDRYLPETSLPVTINWFDSLCPLGIHYLRLTFLLNCGEVTALFKVVKVSANLLFCTRLKLGGLCGPIKITSSEALSAYNVHVSFICIMKRNLKYYSGRGQPQWAWRLVFCSQLPRNTKFGNVCPSDQDYRYNLQTSGFQCLVVQAVLIVVLSLKPLIEPPFASFLHFFWKPKLVLGKAVSQSCHGFYISWRHNFDDVTKKFSFWFVIVRC